jgi:hypothetical protein
MKTKPAPDELLVITKTYDLVIWTCNHVSKFPRSFRFTLGHRLEYRLYDLLEVLVRAKYDRQHRGEFLRHANQEIELLRFQYRVAKDLKCLSVESYGFAARSVNEIGQMVGGWLKQSSQGGPVRNETPRQPLA